MKLENNDLSRFDYLAEFHRETRSQCVVIFKHLILNLKVMFSSVSYSLNKKSIRNFLDFNNVMILNGAGVDDGLRCGVSPLFDLFNVKLTPVTSQLSRFLPHLQVDHEWQRLVPLFTEFERLVRNKTEQRLFFSTDREKELMRTLQTHTTSNLIDVFGVIARSYFHSSWSFVVRVLTIMPTTVAREQSFSFFQTDVPSQHGRRNGKDFPYGKTETIRQKVSFIVIIFGERGLNQGLPKQKKVKGVNNGVDF